MRKGLVLLSLLFLVGCNPYKVESFPTLVVMATETATVAFISSDESLILTPEPTPTIDFVELYGEGEWVVGRVLDGDSILVYEDTPENDSIETIILTVQLVGIAAPELDECGGKQAWEALRLLIAGKHVELEYDMYWFEVSDPIYRYVEFNGNDINQWMLEKGWAEAESYKFERKEAYLESQGYDSVNSICIGDPTPDATVAVSHCIWQLFDSCLEMEQAGCAPAYMTDTWYEEEHDHNGDYIACGKGD